MELDSPNLLLGHDIVPANNSVVATGHNEFIVQDSDGTDITLVRVQSTRRDRAVRRTQVHTVHTRGDDSIPAGQKCCRQDAHRQLLLVLFS